MNTELEQRIDALEQQGLGESLTRKQIIIFVATCIVLPAVVAVLGRGLL